MRIFVVCGEDHGDLEAEREPRAVFTDRAAAEVYAGELEKRRRLFSVTELELDAPHAWPAGAWKASADLKRMDTRCWSRFEDGEDPNRPASVVGALNVAIGYGATREEAEERALRLRNEWQEAERSRRVNASEATS